LFVSKDKKTVPRINFLLDIKLSCINAHYCSPAVNMVEWEVTTKIISTHSFVVFNFHFDILTPQVAGVTFSDSDSTPVSKFLNLVQQFFKFGNLTLVQTQATIIDPTIIYP